jgi:ubiquinone/menaquinone biosynthesis C-methylase UbiE
MFDSEEVERIRREYSRRDAFGLSKIYTHTNPAYLFHIQEREREILRLLRDEEIDLSECRILEVGCGTGHILQRFLEFGTNEAAGIDLMENRIRTAKIRYPRLCLTQGNAASLPYKDGVFNLVMQFMCLSSVFDPFMKKQIADEMWRVVQPGGAILSYDLRPPPLIVRLLCLPYYILRRVSRSLGGRRRKAKTAEMESSRPTPIKPLSLSETRMLYDKGLLKYRLVSLDFNLSRIAGKSFLLALLLSYVPFLRTHYVVFVRKPHSGVMK